MTVAQVEPRERRLLILAPVGRDAELARAVLREASIEAVICPDLGALAREIAQGAGALLVSEEAIASEDDCGFLARQIERQAPWSDLPVVLMTHPGADSTAVGRAVRALGNVTLLERPVRVTSLGSSVRTALRAREKQYVAREHLVEMARAARALQASEARLRALFATAAVGIAEVTADGHFAFVNEALCRITGFERDALLFSPVVSIIHPDEKAELRRLIDELLAGRSDSFSTEKRLTRRDGSACWTQFTAAIARDDSGRMVRGVVVVQDIAERKAAEEGLRDADRRKDEFLATLAHELRNPLAPIRSSLHIFRLAGVQDAATQRVCEMMERQVNYMVRIVDDLLEVSRISRGKIELRRELVELTAVLRSAVDTSRPLIDAARHQLTVDVPREGVWLDADPVRLAQVFANLLNNAAKYTPAGGRVALSARTEGGQAVVSLKDTGEGIPPEMLASVFNLFTQLETGKRAQGGLGIGLTLARTLVEMHGGTIEAFSRGRGEGSEFVVRLPLPSAERLRQRADAVESYGVRTLKRVLVVDDNADAAESIGMVLQLLGAEVKVVNAGTEALDCLAGYKPDVVLLDLGMPGMSGYEVARRIRETPGAGGVTIVALTGWGQREDRNRTSDAGFDHHLVKPANVEALEMILAGDSGVPGNVTRH